MTQAGRRWTQNSVGGGWWAFVIMSGGCQTAQRLSTEHLSSPPLHASMSAHMPLLKLIFTRITRFADGTMGLCSVTRIVWSVLRHGQFRYRRAGTQLRRVNYDSGSHKRQPCGFCVRSNENYVVRRVCSFRHGSNGDCVCDELCGALAGGSGELCGVTRTVWFCTK